MKGYLARTVSASITFALSLGMAAGIEWLESAISGEPFDRTAALLYLIAITYVDARTRASERP